MATFQKGLDQSFVEALNNEYQKGGWWKQIADHPSLTIAVRDNYLNVYYKGNSILRLKQTGRTLTGQTHYKYVLDPSVKAPYVSWTNGALDKGSTSQSLIENLENVNGLMRASAPYTTPEKDGVDVICRSNPNVVDLEIALTATNAETDAKSALRIDMAAIQEEAGTATLQFFEAKRFDNSELRASGRPRVLDQIARYEELITEQEQAIRESYLAIAQNLIDLEGASIPKKRRDACQKAVTAGADGLAVSAKPGLIIFGFDKDQKDGLVWAGHRDKLIDALGKERVLLKGNPNNFKNGIHS